MAARNLAPRTRAGYADDLRRFQAFLRDRFGLSQAARVQKRHVLAYLADIGSRGNAGSTQARRLAAIKSFFAYLEEAGIVETNPTSGVPRPRQEVRERRVLAQHEYERLREASRKHARDGAVIELFLQTGLRLSEVAGLKASDVQLPENPDRRPGAIHVTGKGRRSRTITLNWKACAALHAHLEERGGEEGSLFLSRRGTPLGPRAIQEIVRRRMDEAGIAGASVHTLRHTFATHMVRRGTNLRVVQEALGHASLQTTSVYVALARDVMDRQLQANAL